MKRVLVTGARGFIGRHALVTLREQGFEIHAVTHGDPPAPPRDGSWQWHRADLLDIAAIEPLVRRVRPTHLLHFAWDAVPGRYWTSLDNFAWVRASLELLRRFHECGGTRVVMAGTCAEYDWSYGYCYEGVTPTNPATTYGVCKLSMQRMLQAYCAETGVSGAWGRIFFLYGPHEHPSRLVSSVVRSLLQGNLARCSPGTQIRDFMHVQDVADAFVSLLESAVTGPVNIGSGQPVTLREVIYQIAHGIGRSDLVRLGALPMSPSDPPLLCADVRRLSSEVGWAPAYDLDHGLGDTVRWWRDELSREAATAAQRMAQ